MEGLDCLGGVQVFAELESRREELEVESMHLGMSTLEDVFLRIAKESEVEVARKDKVHAPRKPTTPNPKP